MTTEVPALPSFDTSDPIPDYFACPRCYGGLSVEPLPASGSRVATALRCVACSAGYPIRSGLPILLLDEAMRHDGHPSPDGPGLSTASTPPRESTRLRRARNVLETQGLRPFASKLIRAGRTEIERRMPLMRRGPDFSCPCCGASSRFLSYRGRPTAQCPGCGSKERDRLLTLVLTEVLSQLGPEPRILHVAPEDIVRSFLQSHKATYVSIDLMRGLSSFAGELTAAADLTRLPFADQSFDLIVASHVLEHIPDDRSAIREIFRVVRGNGIALLPVPIVNLGRTVEYAAARPDEEMHVRAPGIDYFERYSEAGFTVQERSSSEFSPAFQLMSFHEAQERVGPDGLGGSGRPGVRGMQQWIPVCRRPGVHVQERELARLS